MQKLILIDGNSLLNRAYYATPPMNTINGQPTNAVYAFINMLIRLTGDYLPTHLAVAFDLKAPTFRHKMYDNYKGTRKPSPSELVLQFPLLKRLLKTLNISCFEKEGYEADDIIGTLAKRFEMHTIIISGDRDVFQLVDPTCDVLFTKRGITDTEHYTYQNFTQKYGIPPESVIDLKAIMGDSSDCIPGVAGIGEKGALTLLNTYGSLDNVYSNIDSIKGALKDKLINGKESAYLSKQLATINTNVPLDAQIDALKYQYPYTTAAKTIFEECEFRTLLKKDIFEKQTPEKESENLTQVAVQTQVELTGISVSDVFSCHLGSTISVYSNNNVYDFKIKEGFLDEGLEEEQIYRQLKPLFENSNNTAILFNLKDTLHKLSAQGIEILCKVEDVSIKKYLVNYSGKDQIILEVLSEYGLENLNYAKALFELNQILDEQLIAQEMQNLYSQIELPLARILYSMEKCGFKIDTQILHLLKQRYENELKELSKTIYMQAGENFNINSPKQLAVILFERLGLEKGKKNKTGYSTNVDVLEKLLGSHPIIENILQFRRKQKLLSTYIEGFLPLIDKSSGLVHTVFNQLVTSTGRLSSKEPNLQNIPIRDEDGREIRKFFIARAEDRILVSADYSQIELRLLAAFSGCKKLIEAFNNGEDIHAATAAQVFGVPIDKVDATMRRNAKAVNFGIIYGISDFGLAQNLGTTRAKAAEYIDKYFKNYPEVKEYMNKNVQTAREQGYVTTLLGRRRIIREIASPNFAVRSFGERAAMNMPLQGSSADIIKIAMINVYNQLKSQNLRSQLILQVHDELIVDAFVDEAEKVKQILVTQMQNAVSLSVPLTVEAVSGKRWETMK